MKFNKIPRSLANWLLLDELLGNITPFKHVFAKAKMQFFYGGRSSRVV